MTESVWFSGYSLVKLEESDRTNQQQKSTHAGRDNVLCLLCVKIRRTYVKWG